MPQNTVDRPSTWSRRANAPYYRQRHALEVKHILDEMILARESGDRKPRLIKYADYQEIAPVTLYLKINQAMLYLLDKLDPDGVYKEFREIIHISRARGTNGGIVISYNQGEDDKPLVARATSHEEHVAVEAPPKSTEPTPEPKKPEDWKATLHAFVEKADVGQQLKLNNLNLTADDGEYIKSMIADDKCIVFKATADTLFCVKLTPEQYAKMK